MKKMSARVCGSSGVEEYYWGWKKWIARVVKKGLWIFAREVNIFLTACQGWCMQKI